MASKWKTYSPGEVLNAEDVNDSLNPLTADHLFRSVDAGSVAVPVTGGSKSTAISFPAGRFTVAPVLVVSMNSTTGQEQNYTVKSANVNTTSGVIWLVPNPGASAGSTTITVNWVAVQL